MQGLKGESDHLHNQTLQPLTQGLLSKTWVMLPAGAGRVQAAGFSQAGFLLSSLEECSSGLRGDPGPAGDCPVTPPLLAACHTAHACTASHFAWPPTISTAPQAGFCLVGFFLFFFCLIKCRMLKLSVIQSCFLVPQTLLNFCVKIETNQSLNSDVNEACFCFSL